MLRHHNTTKKDTLPISGEWDGTPNYFKSYTTIHKLQYQSSATCSLYLWDYVAVQQ